MFFTCVVRLTHMFHVWVPRRRLYDSSALHIVGGIIHISLLSSGLSPGETPSETKPSAVLCCNRHISLDSFRHALHTKENFSPVHFGCVLLAENRHYIYEYQGVTMGQRAMISVFVFTSSTNFMGVFVPVSHSCSLLFHYKNYMKRESLFFHHKLYLYAHILCNIRYVGLRRKFWVRDVVTLAVRVLYRTSTFRSIHRSQRK